MLNIKLNNHLYHIISMFSINVIDYYFLLYNWITTNQLNKTVRNTK